MNILFVCTHNRCRSILSEAIFNHMAQGSPLKAHSAGSQPVGEVHPLSRHYLKERGISVAGLTSQSWNDFESLKPQVVITVCDSAAKEVCPLWFGEGLQMHWPLPDPSKLTSSTASDEAIRRAFFDVMDTIERRTQTVLDIYQQCSDQKVFLERLSHHIASEVQE